MQNPRLLTDRRLLILLVLVVAVLAYFTRSTSAQTDRLQQQNKQLNYVCEELDTSHARINRALDRIAASAATAPGRTTEQQRQNSEFFRDLRLADLTCPPA